MYIFFLKVGIYLNEYDGRKALLDSVYVWTYQCYSTLHMYIPKWQCFVFGHTYVTILCICTYRCDSILCMYIPMWQYFPSQPIGHWQVKDPWVLIHRALFWQSVAFRHSFLSAKEIQTFKKYKQDNLSGEFSPMCPGSSDYLPCSHISPCHPGGHWQVNPPGVLIQVAPFWQTCILHSSTSMVQLAPCHCSVHLQV